MSTPDKASIDAGMSFLTDDEVQRLILMLGTFRGVGVEFTTDEVAKVVAWAEEVRMNDGILQNVLDGRLAVNVRADGELEFRMTDAGTRDAEKLVAEAKGES